MPSAKATEALNSTAQDILYTLNMKLLSMKLPAHLRIVNLRYNERGNHTGLITEQTIAECMVFKFRKVLLKTALRFDLYINGVQAIQQWTGLKVHAVVLARYYPHGRLEQICKEIAAEPSALELAIVPRWILSLNL